jgi:glyoxalase family protein
MSIQGLHHITLVTTDAQRNIDFYTRVLGLRFVKKTVNFDDPSSYHLYFGDATGSPGTAITFFEWKGVPKGAPGIGGTHHFAMTVRDYDGLLQWKRRLTDLEIKVKGPYDRRYFQSIYFKDPDGVNLEIATYGPGWTVDEAPDQIGSQHISALPALTRDGRDESAIEALSWPDPVPSITKAMALDQGMHHITAMSSDLERTHSFYGALLGLKLVKQTDNYDLPDSKHWYWGVGAGLPKTLITYFGYRPGAAPKVRMGAGQTHHFALSVADEATQLTFREALLNAGYRVSPVMDRIYFKSIYTNDPDGHIVEIATATPGFLVDESIETLGTALKLPPWIESYRPQIEQALTPVTVQPWQEPQ